MGAKDQFDPTRFGIFADSEGLADVDEMDLEQGEEYYGMSRKCEGCGARKQCRIDWAELYCLQYGVDPARVGEIVGRTDIFDTSWAYDSRFKVFHPQYRCGCHGNPLVLFDMTPRMAENALHAAGRNGVISDGQKRVINFIRPVVKRLNQGVSPAQVAAEYRAAAQRQVQGPPPGYPNGPPIRRR